MYIDTAKKLAKNKEKLENMGKKDQKTLWN